MWESPCKRPFTFVRKDAKRPHDAEADAPPPTGAQPARRPQPKKAGERRQAHGRTSEPRRQAERAAASARRRHHAMESGEKTPRFLRESAALHGRSRPARPQGASLTRIIPGRHRLRQRSRRKIAAPTISPHADPHFLAGSDAKKRPAPKGALPRPSPAPRALAPTPPANRSPTQKRAARAIADGPSLPCAGSPTFWPPPCACRPSRPCPCARRPSPPAPWPGSRSWGRASTGRGPWSRRPSARRRPRTPRRWP